jgi:hypothetical protein
MVSFLTVCQRVVAHWRIIVFSLIFAFCAYPLLVPDKFQLMRVASRVILVFVIASQIFWIRRVLYLGGKCIPGKLRRAWLAVIAIAVYLFFFVYSFTHMEAVLPHVAVMGAFTWWLVGSVLGFGLVIIFWAAERVARASAWVYSHARNAGAARFGTLKPAPIAAFSPARRHFLQQTAIALSATPFLASAYGLLYGRLDVEVTRRHIRLARLPKSFEGFRIAQLSDFHISPFMPADEIRRCVTITNQLKPDLVALTGDYLSWDPEAEGEVVQALVGLRAPYGVFGCLGNHEVITQTEESITRLFAAQGIHILRQERASIRSGDESLNLIGIDDSQPDLNVIGHLVMPDAVNILLVHNIGTDFEHAVELGIDLTLMGHTHGGQLSLEFLRRGLALIRLETPYVSGLYKKSGGQLYVNRGIGTTLLPIRLGARPEITLLELSRT